MGNGYPSKFNLTTEPIAKAVKFVIYGCEGIGKTTLASKLPKVIFIDTEGSTEHMKIFRYPRPQSWAELLDMVRDAKTLPKLQTLVIDTLDWADKLCAESLIAEKQWDSIETPGYGKGYTMLKERFGKLLNLLNELTAAGIHVGFTAHAQLRKVENPEDSGAYDHWEMKCSKQVAPLVKEWCDLMLFANYETMVIHGQTKMDKNKVAGNKRVMYANHAATFDAKNRFGLPDKMPLDYACIKHIFEEQTTIEPPQPEPIQKPQPALTSMRRTAPRTPTPPPAPPKEPEREAETLPDVPFTGPVSGPAIPDEAADPLGKIDQRLASLMRTNGVTYEEVQAAIGEKGYFEADMPIEFYPEDFVSGCLVGAWDQVFAFIKSRRDK